MESNNAASDDPTASAFIEGRDDRAESAYHHAGAEALANYIAEEGSITFAQMNEFITSRGINVSGDEELTGEHVRQPHVWESTTLYAPVSSEYLETVGALFDQWPVRLMIGDPALFSSGEEPWYVAWIGGPDGRSPLAVR